ncbi:hypothetical protein [Thermoactinomyces vulgaris]|uniref:hypothetical protein n=1 Tax=Thermoactinomyces vulgaris TaxID=2026 RepID=UPI0015EE9F49|nr:hypothetical protein [Thermoactinomyces vulgaris]
MAEIHLQINQFLRLVQLNWISAKIQLTHPRGSSLYQPASSSSIPNASLSSRTTVSSVHLLQSAIAP